MAKIKNMGSNEIIYEYISIHLDIAYDHTRRSHKLAYERRNKLSDELVRRGLLTEEQAGKLSIA